jgi:hypothetical protein
MKKFADSKSDSDDGKEMDHLDIFFKQLQEEDDTQFQTKK